MRHIIKAALKAVHCDGLAREVYYTVKRPGGVRDAMLARLRSRPGTRVPGAMLNRIAGRLSYWDPKGCVELCRMAASISRRVNGLLPRASHPTGGPVALVALLRGMSAGHLMHCYIAGACLREMGYDVTFMVCDGNVERCGINQEISDEWHPPFTCKACRDIVRSVDHEGFKVACLNDFASADEARLVTEVADLGGNELRAYRMNGIGLLDANLPFLMRYYGGDSRKIEQMGQEVREHLKASVRFLSRFERLVESKSPACICLYNGLFMPEHLFYLAARAQRIDTLTVERGMRKDTVFFAHNDLSVNYRCDALWARTKNTISLDNVGQAETYLARRITGPEDPTGQVRPISEQEESRYATLAKKPYVIYFAPVLHDTASMGKAGPAGDFLESLSLLSQLAGERKKRLIVRAHPDERSALNPSRYTLREVMNDRGLLTGGCVECLDSTEKWDPYKLAQHADAIVVYNGTLGIELPALGYGIYNIGNAHYSGKGFTSDIAGQGDLGRVFEAFRPRIPAEQRELALRYLYFYVYEANLPLDAIMTEPRSFLYVPSPVEDRARQEVQLKHVVDHLKMLFAADKEGARNAWK